MSSTRETWGDNDLRGYAIIPWARGEDVLFYTDPGDGKGQWIAVSRDPATETIYLYKDWHGSCAGCDWFTAWYLEVDMDELHRDHEEVTEFLRRGGELPDRDRDPGYRPFADVPRRQFEDYLRDPSKLKRIFPKNTQVFDNRPDVFPDMVVRLKIELDCEMTVPEVLNCNNQELKMEALDHYGLDRFHRDAEYDILDREPDGPDQLVQFGRDAVCVLFHDPSKPEGKNEGLLPVPPHMETVREAKAWSFGFDDPEEYRPEVET